MIKFLLNRKILNYKKKNKRKKFKKKKKKLIHWMKSKIVKWK
jgi:hypothetical protein